MLKLFPFVTANFVWAINGAAAQATLVGRVFEEGPNRSPIVGAEAFVIRSRLVDTSRTGGSFRLSPLLAGDNALVIRATGFEPDTFLVVVVADESISRDFVLKASATTLRGIRVTASEVPIRAAKHVEFYERMRVGIGQFLDSATIERWEGRPTGDMLATVPGIDVRRGLSSKAWAVGGRYVSPGKCAFCKHPSRDSILDRADIAAGAGIACYADVYVDGVQVYSSTSRQTPLFDLNSIPPSQIQGVEFYAGGASLPARFNKTSGGCGVLLIWTK